MDASVAVGWFLGAPFLDDQCQVAGILIGEKPVDLSRAGARSVLIYLPVSQVRDLVSL